MPEPTKATPQQRVRKIRGEWAPMLALGFVLLAIVALVAMPWWSARRVRALNAELTEVIAPARGLVTRINASLAIQGSLLRDYLASRDPQLTRRYHEAYARERAASAMLPQLVDRVGGVRQPLDALISVQRGWHLRIDSLLRDEGTLRDGDPLRGREYEALLASVSRMDEALEAAGNRRRADIRRLERERGRVAAVLGVLALAAALTVGALTRGVRRYARMLEQRSSALEQAIASRARLMRGLTHDLKNPLQVIDGHAQILADGIHGPLQPNQIDGLARIRKASAEMLSLIEDLLDLARAEAGQLRVKPHLVDLRQLVNDMVEGYRPAASRAGVSLSLRADARQLPTVTDPARARQIVENLLSNAVKYTESGGDIVVTAGERQRDGDSPVFLAISVANTGAGIPEAQQQAIFGDFTRMDAHADIPGAGLGLSIARRMATLLGGDLTLESRPGQGATFTLWLPRDRRRPPEPRSADLMA